MNLLFTTKTCPNCPAAEKVLRDHGIEYEKIYAEDKPELASYYGVMSVPTLITDDADLLTGVSEIIRFAEEQSFPQF